MEIYNEWFLLALVLLALEIASGTFYLLVVSVSMALAGIAAIFSVGFTGQLILCALSIVLGVVMLRRWKSAQRYPIENTNLDIGQPVKVLIWHENGKARVSYRGAQWDAEVDSTSREGQFYIKGMRGSILILTNLEPSHN
jgi:membrane protein implicated in regulation of membrane protease activity